MDIKKRTKLGFRMKKHLIVIGTAVLLLIVGLSGCTDTQETPKIEFIQENGWLTVSLVEKSNLTWNDINISLSSGKINISLSSGKYSYIGFHSSIEISSIKPYGNGTSCPYDWGVITQDNGIYLQHVNAIVTLYWIPTNVSLGKWNFI
jgi:hypothetical protein